MKAFSILFTALIVLILAACGSPNSDAAREVEAMQSRDFATDDRGEVLRMVVATLLDMGCVVRSVEPRTGSISAFKGVLDARAVVGEPKDGRITVQLDASISSNGKFRQVDSPQYYQEFFFDPLAESLGLPALPAT